MNTKLNHVKNWLPLAKKANWSVTALARQSGISARTLERYFLKNLSTTPKKWLARQRQIQAHGLLNEAFSVKETASLLGYQYPNQLSREFKQYWGRCPAMVSRFNNSNQFVP